MILPVNRLLRLDLRKHECQLVQNPDICAPIKDSFMLRHSLCDLSWRRLALLTVLMALSTTILEASTKSLREDKAKLAFQAGKDTRRVNRGKSVKRKIAGDEAHYYQLKLEAGDYAYATVEQRSVDVAVTLIAPNDEQLLKIDQSWIAGTETLHWVAQAAGNYVLKVSPSLKQAPSGEYKLKVRKKRAATPQDRIRAEAEIAFNEVAQPDEQLTVELRRKALERYQRASQLWRSTGDRLEEATVLDEVGKTFYDLGEIQKSMDPYGQALVIWRAIKAPSGEAESLEGIGRVHYYLGEMEKALDFYNRALAIWRDLKDPRGEGMITDNIGAVYYQMSDFDKAIDFFNRALSLKRAAGDVSGQALTVNNLAVAYQKTNQMEKALDTYNESLVSSRATGNHSLEAKTLLNLGRVYDDLGQQDKAL